ncbi:MAG: acetate kinase, partial [Prevotella sp.]|nr:acetate kinase [Prevotella sp.]
MKILVLNCGSSSIKYQLIESDSKEVIAKGGIEKIGLPGAFIKFNVADGKKTIEQDIPEHTVGVQLIFDVLTNAEYG